MRWGSVAPLMLASAAIMGSPGPATISLVAVVSAYGVRRALPYLAGLIVGTELVLLAVATGITTAILAVPGIHPVLLAISATYILWLAFRIATAPPLAAQAAGAAGPSLGGGILVGIANPKAWIAIAVVFASGRLFHEEASDAAAKVIVLSAMIVLIMAAWLIAGASLAPLLGDPQRARVVNYTLAAVLVISTALAMR